MLSRAVWLRFTVRGWGVSVVNFPRRNCAESEELLGAFGRGLGFIAITFLNGSEAGLVPAQAAPMVSYRQRGRQIIGAPSPGSNRK